MLVDSHCHLNFPELISNLPELFANMEKNGVGLALCVSVNLTDFHEVINLAETYPHLYASVGVHPDYEDEEEPSVERLAELANHPKVIAIGETGLDYFRLKGDLEWQRERFRNHIRAAKLCGKPLIIHTREAAADTLRIMEEEGAASVGGVMHCFTESLEVAERAIALGFYISFSGIVTFKNAIQVKEVAKNISLDRVLVETDSPYLAPAPFRGKTNQPAYVKHVAEEVARLRGISEEELAEATTRNFMSLFKVK
ncbi:TatD family hydrolase [Sulfuricella sp.]|uniref:TatD family hydrolase n=1 Tax=Sulfuricella sp. TaxID=2099377 RepID=UPI002C2F147B|nr:TatD family hydrolase [Sulfuricella sp.]HUX62742.1 TatD family hydrolase [Sulfuricella sp.]